jgi:uncharacterized protein (DUF697 family)
LVSAAGSIGTGAAIGSGLLSFVPGAGTVAGGIIGGAVGGILSFLISKGVISTFSDSDAKIIEELI